MKQETIEILNKTFLCYRNTEKFLNHDYNFEIVKNKPETIDDFHYVELPNGKGFEKILDPEEAFCPKLSSSYKGTTFEYKVYVINGEKIVDVFKIITAKTGILEIPDEIDGGQVFSLTLFKDSDPTVIKKFIVPNYCIKISCFTKLVVNLKEIVFKNGFSSTGDAISSISNLVRYSKVGANITFEKGCGLCVKGDCLLSEDGKKLYKVLTKESTKIPEGVEILGTGCIPADFKTSSIITWPKSVKIAEDHFLPSATYDFFKHNVLPGGLKTISIDCFTQPQIGFAYMYLSGTTLVVNCDFNDMTDECVRHIRLCRKVDNSNPNFVFENNFLMSKDRKTIFRFIGLKEIKSVNVPSTVESVKKFAFYDTNVKTVHVINEIPGFKEQMKQFGIEVVSCDSKSKKSDPIMTVDKVTYELKGHKVSIKGKLSTKVLNVDINEFGKAQEKEFVITSDCSLIKEIIIPEGVTKVSVDGDCFSEDFKTEIIQLPSTCKVNKVFEQLNELKSLMLVIINPSTKPRWTIHSLSFAVGCMSKFSMPAGVFNNFDAYFYHEANVDQTMSVFNEITYIRSFTRDKLIVTDDAYYYKKNAKELYVLKVKDINEYRIPETVNGLKVTGLYGYALNKYKGKEIDLSRFK